MSSRAKQKNITKTKQLTKKWVVKKSVELPPPTTESSQNPPIPDDLLLSGIARVSRLYYPALSLVSKRFRSLLVSPELYKTRSLLGRKESCLYVCLQFLNEPNPRWFTLSRKPDRTLANDTRKTKSSGYFLASISIPHSPQIHQAGLVAVGSSIYAIGGPVNKFPSSNVSILDCRSHTWQEAPSMRVKRKYPVATVLDGKIYVAGGRKDCNPSNWMEVFDTETQTWETVLSPLAKRCGGRLHRTIVIEGEMYMFGRNAFDVAYKPNEDKWEAVEEDNLHLGWSGVTYCTIDNVLYGYSRMYGINWYDHGMKDWIKLKGLKGLVRLIDYGGKMVFFWENILPSKQISDKTENWCAVIALERRNSEEIWGNVEWLDVVIAIPDSCEFVCALAVTL